MENKMVKKRTMSIVGVVSLLLVFAASAAAGPISWVDWTAITPGSPGSATGTADVGGSFVDVTYSGEVVFGQRASGRFFWTHLSSYLSSGVPNLPGTPGAIALIGGNNLTNTITFSRPVVNPVLAVFSLGRPSVRVDYIFGEDFDILSSGDGYFDTGSMVKSGNAILTSHEGNGVIQFSGVHTAITFQVPQAENFGGFQVGIAGVQDPSDDPTELPEPNSFGLVVLGGVSVLAHRIVYRRRFFQRSE